jgi:trypsin-like peptidase
VNGLVLALAIAGQCYGGSCSVDPIVRSRIETVSSAPQWADYAVRIKVDHGTSTGYGSGTVIASGDGERKLVITARHVLGRNRSGISVQHRGRDYPATWLSVSSEADIGAVSADIPGTFPDLRIASEAPSQAIMLGYGKDGRLHSHSGRLTGYATPVGEQSPDMAFAFGAESGDSGGGVFNDRGEFSGVLWGTDSSRSMAVSTAKIHRFLQCQYGQPGTSGERRIATISPFFFKFRRERWASTPALPPESAPIIVQPAPVQPQPVTPAPVTPSTPTVVQGPPGPAGPQGPAGPAGKDAPAIDQTSLVTTIVQAVMKEIKALPAPPSPPIYIRFKTATGTTSPQIFNTQVGPNGQPYYAIELDPTALPSTTVPVAPIPAK